DQNVPLRYLKGAKWVEDEREFAPRYFTTDKEEDKSILVPVKFDFATIQWGTVRPCPEGGIYIDKPAPIYLRLQIFNEGCTDRSQWVQEMGVPLKKTLLPLHFDLEVKQETPQILISTYPIQNKPNKR